MRILKVNNILVDIDEQTAIGIDYQSYDIKQPGKSFITVSNSFTVPITSNNLAIFGVASDPQSTSTKIYQQSICDYWVDNEKLIDNSKIRVDEIGKRMSLFIFEKADIWDTLKGVKWDDFLIDFILWMQTSKSLPSATSPFVGTFQNFIADVSNNTEGIILPMTFGNLYSQPYFNENLTIENSLNPLLGNNIYLFYRHTETDNSVTSSYGGHFCIFAKTIFEYLEFIYNVDFLTDGNLMAGNIWNDAIIPNIYIESKNIGISVSYTLPNYSIYFRHLLNPKLLPYSDASDKGDKTLYDFCNAFFQHFNMLKDEFEIDGVHTIRLARFDELNTAAPIKDWTGRLSNGITFKPSFENYAQLNYIKFKSVFETGDKILNSKLLTSNNVNIDKINDLFEIDAHVPSLAYMDPDYILDLSKKEALKTFTFMISDGLTTDNVNVNYYFEGVIENAVASLQLPKAALYNLNSEYTLLDSIIKYPKYYEVEKWVTMADLKDFEFFKLYFFSELNGAFFVNKISGFNPDKAKQATKLELIKISNRAPDFPYITVEERQFWVDGVDDEFTDGLPESFF